MHPLSTIHDTRLLGESSAHFILNSRNWTRYPWRQRRVGIHDNEFVILLLADTCSYGLVVPTWLNQVALILLNRNT